LVEGWVLRALKIVMWKDLAFGKKTRDNPSPIRN